MSVVPTSMTLYEPELNDHLDHFSVLFSDDAVEVHNLGTGEIQVIDNLTPENAERVAEVIHGLLWLFCD